MFNSKSYSLTNLRGFKASTMPQASYRFAGICRIGWTKNVSTGMEHVSFNMNLDKNLDNPKHLQPDNC